MKIRGRKLSGSSYFYIFIMAVMLIIIGSAVAMEYFASKLLPLLFGGAGFILAGIGFAQEVLSEPKPKAAAEGGHKEGAAGGWGAYLLHMAWIVGLAVGTYLVGFVGAIPLFLLFYMRWLGTKWLTGFICAVIVTAVVWGLFEQALDIELYRGVLMRLLGG